MVHMQSTNNNPASDCPYLDLLSQVDYSPVFIMGDHRSGTTLLYKTLVATGCFNFVRAYHVIKYDEILSNHINQTEKHAIQELEEFFTSLGISDRTIDKVMATPDLPEEYGFILKNVAQEKSYITPQNLPIFQQLCRKIQFISEPGKPLLLKNPWDFNQFMYVKNVVPSAKFIFIHRHPVHVINSKLKAARTLLADWNSYVALIATWYKQIFENPVQRNLYRLLYSKYFNLGLRRVTKQSMESTAYYLKNVESLPEPDYLCVKYEDLCQAPEANINKILGFLDLETRSTLEYQKLISPRAIDLLPEVQKQYENIHQKLQDYFVHHEYDC
jgi:hypothetical protein